MDYSGALWGFPTFFVSPGTYFLYAGSEISFKVQQFVGRFNKACYARFFQTDLGEEHLAVFVSFQFGDVSLCFSGYHEDFGIFVLNGFTYHVHIFVSVDCTRFVYIANIHYRFAGKQKQFFCYFLFVFRFKSYCTCRFTLFQRILELHKYVISLLGSFISSGLSLFLYFLDTALDGFQVF